MRSPKSAERLRWLLECVRSGSLLYKALVLLVCFSELTTVPVEISLELSGATRAVLAATPHLHGNTPLACARLRCWRDFPSTDL